ncbi:MAG: hypothetical protein MUD16_14880 [Desulfobacterales bacterium]|nr:hypothetical protein [Desulfobacterales bacterium]
MPRQPSTLFLAVVSASGCAGTQPVQLELGAGARIGILNVLESQMTHRDVGTLRFDSFTNLYAVDRGLPLQSNRR